MEHIAERRNHGAAYQEAKVPAADHERLKLALAKTYRRQTIFSDTCPEHMAPAAGMAAIVSHPLQVICLQPRSQQLQDVMATGRIALNQFCLGAGVEFLHFNVYGWDGAHENHLAAARTDALFAAIKEIGRAHV